MARKPRVQYAGDNGAIGISRSGYYRQVRGMTDYQAGANSSIAALKEITELGHELMAQVILMTDNGPMMKSRRFRNFARKTELLIHIRSRKYQPHTVRREERYHGSFKLGHVSSAAE